MGSDKLRSCKIDKKNNSIMLRYAVSNISPAYIVTGEFMKGDNISLEEKVRQLSLNILYGTLNVSGAGPKYRAVADEGWTLLRVCCPDISYKNDFSYYQDFSKKAHDIVANEYMAPTLLTRSANHSPSKDIIAKLTDLNEEARNAYTAKDAEFKRLGIYLIRSAWTSKSGKKVVCVSDDNEQEKLYVADKDKYTLGHLDNTDNTVVCHGLYSYLKAQELIEAS